MDTVSHPLYKLYISHWVFVLSLHNIDICHDKLEGWMTYHHQDNPTMWPLLSMSISKNLQKTNIADNQTCTISWCKFQCQMYALDNSVMSKLQIVHLVC